MTNDTRSPDDIEREIEEQRSHLSSNIEDLQDKFSIDTMVRQIGDQFREHGGDIGRSISEQVKANPIPLALTGIGLAWMMFGTSQGRQPNTGFTRDGYGTDIGGYDTDIGNFQRSRLQQGRPYTPPNPVVAKAHDGPSWAQEDHSDDHGTSMSDRISGGVDAVKDKAASAGSSAAEGAQSVRDRLSSTGNRISEGTEALTEEGRRRVIAARRKAVEMRESFGQSVSDGADAASDFYDRQPLVIGALALAVGAALAGALPRTRTEDDLMGSQSDDLFHEAERVYQEEKSRAMSVARSVKDEIVDIADEAMADLDDKAPGDKSAAEAAGDRAKSAAGRIADTAKASAGGMTSAGETPSADGKPSADAKPTASVQTTGKPAS